MINRLLVQHREPNVDRFLEVCVTMELLELNLYDYGFQIVGPKTNYSQTLYEFIKIHDHIKGVVEFPEKDRKSKPFTVFISETINKNCIFKVSLPEHWIFKIEGRKIESFDTIKERIHKALQMFEVGYQKGVGYDSPVLQLLKTAVSRLDLNSYETQAILDMALAIAALDQSEVVRPEHIAEAIQYASIRNKEDK